jgi:Ni/Co efflux regulator RcnB
MAILLVAGAPVVASSDGTSPTATQAGQAVGEEAVVGQGASAATDSATTETATGDRARSRADRKARRAERRARRMAREGGDAAAESATGESATGESATGESATGDQAQSRADRKARRAERRARRAAREGGQAGEQRAEHRRQKRMFVAGDRVPRKFLAGRRVIKDYARFQLTAPSGGDQWVRGRKRQILLVNSDGVVKTVIERRRRHQRHRARVQEPMPDPSTEQLQDE